MAPHFKMEEITLKSKLLLMFHSKCSFVRVLIRNQMYYSSKYVTYAELHRRINFDFSN